MGSYMYEAECRVVTDLCDLLQTETSDNCTYDRLTIGDAAFCGQHEVTVAVDIPSVSDGDFLPIEFVSDDTVSGAGFLVRWELSGILMYKYFYCTMEYTYPTGRKYFQVVNFAIWDS